MASQKNLKASIDPSEVLMWSGQSMNFTFIVNKNRVNANWSLSEPLIGTIDKNGRLKVENELRYGKTEVIASATVEGQVLKATALVRIIVGIGLMHVNIHFADDFLKIPTISWSDDLGRRAAKLIIDAVYQLPKKFLEKVGTVALVRANWADPPTSGVHLPLPGRVVVLSEYMFKALRVRGKLPPEITEADREFVRNFVHEIAHVILANDGLSDFARWSLICLSAATLAGGIYSGIQIGGAAATLAAGWGAVPVAAGSGGAIAGIIAGGAVMVVADFTLLLSLYYGNPLRQEDLAYRFSKATGWSVRDPNFLTLFWSSGRVPPNVITGFRFVGWAVGLHNENAPKNNTATNWRKAGFYDDYSGTDVHEHFAEAVAEIAMNSEERKDLLKHPLFEAAKELFVKERIFPKNWDRIDVGKTILGFSRNQVRKADFEDFGVFLGLYAGPKKSAKAVVKPQPPKKTSAKNAGAEIKVFAAGSEKISTEESGQIIPANTPKEEEFVEGYGRRWDEDEIADTQELVQRLNSVGKAVRRFQTETAPVLDEVRKTLKDLPFPIREGSFLELLRSAECHGTGLQRISSDSDSTSPSIENGMQTGDMLVDKRNNLWIVTRVEKKLAAEIVGLPRLGEAGKVEKGFDPNDLLFYWRPTAIPRVWFNGQTAADAKAFVEIVRLWGLEMTADEEYSLYRSGSFITVILKAFGKRVRDLAGKEDQEVLEYCAAHGELLKWKTERELKLRDVVRLNDKRWAFVLRTTPLDLIVQGGGKGEINEEQNATKILHDVDCEKISHVWCWVKSIS